MAARKSFLRCDLCGLVTFDATVSVSPFPGTCRNLAHCRSCFEKFGPRFCFVPEHPGFGRGNCDHPDHVVQEVLES